MTNEELKELREQSREMVGSNSEVLSALILSKAIEKVSESIDNLIKVGEEYPFSRRFKEILKKAEEDLFRE